MPKPSPIEMLPDSAKQIIYQEHADDKNFTEIAAKLNNIYEDELEGPQVRRWWNAHSDDARKEITEDNLGRLKEEKMKDLLDSADQLQKINKKINQAFDNLNPDRREDMKMLKDLSGEIRQHLKFQKEFIEQVTESTEIDNVENMNVEQNYNAIEITQEFNKYIKDLEEDGVIEVNDEEALYA